MKKGHFSAIKNTVAQRSVPLSSVRFLFRMRLTYLYELA
jgi:hypothetical protein